MNVEASGRADFRFASDTIKTWDIVGRSLVVHDVAKEMQSGDGR